MGYVIDIDESNFQAEVIDSCQDKLVLIDFFATWCGPCKLLMPMLENLLKEYDFILAKIDIDRHPELAKQFAVEGVPDVRIAWQGKIMPGFVGALPEAEIRELLKKFNLKSDLEIKLASIQQAIATNNVSQAKQLFDELFTKYPENPPVILAAANFLIGINYLEDALKMLKTISIDNREYYPKAQSMQTLIQFKQVVQNPGEGELDHLFSQAAQLILAENYDAALSLFLQIVEQSRKYRDDGARKAMISVFNLIGNDHPLTKKYQKELMLALY